LTSEGAGAEIYVSLDKKVGKRGKASAWALIDTIGKSF
jgi:hypothetical protein